MKRTTKILSKAGVLLIAAAMLLSAVPAVVADTGDIPDPRLKLENSPLVDGLQGLPKMKHEPYLTGERIAYSQDGTFDGGVGATDFIGYTSPAAPLENALGLTGGGLMIYGVGLTPALLAGFDGYVVDTVRVGFYGYTGDFYDGNVDILDGSLTLLTSEPFAHTMVADGAVDSVDIPITSPPTVDETEDLYVIMNVNHLDGTFPAAGAAGPTNQGMSDIVDLGSGFESIGNYGFFVDWMVQAGVSPGGPSGDCLEDQCDFVIGAINMQEGYINELPQLINISIANLGEIGIGEVKLLADVYKKICGPTSTIYEDEKYNLQTWESEVGDVWTMIDDGDGDTWVLQGGADNRWLTDNQAWRSTAGEDRSYGGDEDNYLGLCDTCSGPDSLIWNPMGDDNVISGAACAEFTFNHWMEGEYTFDEDGNVVPIDYGTLSYSLDGGATWTDIPIGDFVAYDTEDEWETISIKFINTGIYNDTEYDWQHPYQVVCDDCVPEEGDIVFYEEFPAIAELAIRFDFFKDPCLNFEGWYIDDLSLTRTEDYELELVHQTHEILELPGCDPNEDPWMYFEFPLGWDPEPDTWYQMEICGQVFDPAGCEINVENNCLFKQFYVTDIHDVACKDIELITDEVTEPGSTVSVNMTVENLGTYAESNIPVQLLVENAVVDNAIDEEFETDPSSRWSFAFFTGFQAKNLWRWTEGDDSIDMIYDVDEAQARSKLPGEESLICANEGTMPYMEEDIGCFVYDGNIYDLSDASEATLSFFTKWSLEIEYDTYYQTVIPGTEGVGAAMVVHPTTGPDSAFWWLVDFGAWNHGGVYHNDWINIEVDMKGLAEGFAYDGIVPPIEFGWAVLTFNIDGDTSNPANPIPWSGIMLDRIDFDIVGCGGGGDVVDETTISTLAPGEEATVTLSWSDAEFCTHCLTGDTQLATDMDTSNDKCTTIVRVIDMMGEFDFDSIDLTGDGDCLWDLCNNRPGGDDHFAWAGINEEQWGHYVNNMDDLFISPTIDLSDDADEGFVVNFTTWYKFFDGNDFGKVYVRGSPAQPWTKIGTFTGDSDDVFEDASFFIEEALCTATTQVAFRMVSDDEGVSEGWYIDDVALVDVTGVPTLAPGDVIFHQEVHTPADSWSFANCDGSLGYAMQENFQLTADVPIGQVSIVGIPAYYSGGWVPYPPANAVFNVEFYDDAYGVAQPSTLLDSFVINTFDAITYVDNYGGFDAYEWTFTLPDTVEVTGQEGWLSLDGQILFGSSDDGDGYSYHVGSGATVYDRAMTLYEGGPSVLLYGDTVWFDDFEREDIAPWTCIESTAGDYWKHSTDVNDLPNAATDLGDPGFEVCTGYSAAGTGLNDVLYTELDLTGGQTYAEFDCWMDYDFATEEVFIEISADWEEGTPMDDGTWITFWQHTQGDSYGDNSGGWVKLSDLVQDDRFVLNQYLGEKVFMRFRLTTPGDGAAVGDGWAIDDLMFTIKGGGDDFVDEEAPVTSISFNAETGQVTLIAQDFPLNKNVGVKATYYDIGDGEQVYSAPFTLPEGTTTITYYSVDNNDNEESPKTATYTVDTTAPTVEFVSPEEGKLYLFGSPLMDRILGSKTLCIGKVPIEVDADDGEGKGIKLVTFEFDNGDSGFADSAPYSYVYRGMHFGALTITATAIDNAGLVSQPAEMEVTVYSLGLL